MMDKFEVWLDDVIMSDCVDCRRMRLGIFIGMIFSSGGNVLLELFT